MISKQIVEKFDGKISLETEQGKGSTFSFTFKLQYVEKRRFPDDQSICSSLIANDLLFAWKPP